MESNKNPEDIIDDSVKTFLDKAMIFISETLSYIFWFIVVISFYEVLMRYGFNMPTMWVHESASFLGGCLFLLGGSYALATNKHVRVVLIYDNVRPKIRSYLNLFHHTMGLILFSVMAYASFASLKDAWFAPWGEFRIETSGSAWNPPFPAILKLMVFVTMCIVTIQFILHIFAEIRKIKTHKTNLANHN